MTEPRTLPTYVRADLADFAADVGAGLGGYGRARAAANYMTALLSRSPSERLSQLLGGSRSSQSESARTLLTKIPWRPAAVAYRVLDRLHRTVPDDGYVWSVQAMGLRLDEADDEPRFNAQVVSAAFVRAGQLYEVPILANVDDRQTWPAADDLVGRQLHTLGHLRDRSAQRRVCSYGAVSSGNRFRYQWLGWRYFQLLPPPDLPIKVWVSQDMKHRETLSELHQQVRREGKESWVRWAAVAAIEDEAPDWPEHLYALPTSEARTYFFVTNAGSDWEYSRDLLEVAKRNSLLPASLLQFGAGAYRGPSEAAFLRHLALVLAAVAFVTERRAQGCPWARRLHNELAELQWRQALTVLPAAGLEHSPELEIANTLYGKARVRNQATRLFW